MKAKPILGALIPTLSRPLFRFALTVILPLTFLALGACGRQGQSGNPASGKQQAAPAAEVTVVSIAPKTFPAMFEAVGVSRTDYEDALSARQTALARVQSARAPVWPKRG